MGVVDLQATIALIVSNLVHVSFVTITNLSNGGGVILSVLIDCRGVVVPKLSGKGGVRSALNCGRRIIFTDLNGPGRVLPKNSEWRANECRNYKNPVHSQSSLS